jgi:hypothetical protein
MANRNKTLAALRNEVKPPKASHNRKYKFYHESFEAIIKYEFEHHTLKNVRDRILELHKKWQKANGTYVPKLKDIKFPKV